MILEIVETMEMKNGNEHNADYQQDIKLYFHHFRYFQ